ncbi:hypothetical protein [Methanobrevibacter sp.]|uniref:hypothetical protein n=1 Tax=Methanobrevibacter sp. TaxID=66852 RepID=UPI00388EBC63
MYCYVSSVDYYNTTTDSQGFAEFALPLSKGSYTLFLINPETSEVVNDTIKVFDVLKGNKDIEMYYDSGKYYKVRVYGDDGKPVGAGKKVKFAIGSKTVTKKTDKKGYAKVKITVKPGAYYIGALYKDFAVVNVLLVNQVIEPKTSYSAKVAKATIKYKVKFLGKNKKNKKITVKFNKKKYTAKTNKKGIATFTLKTPKKVGYYKLVASYKKSKVTSIYYKYYA